MKMKEKELWGAVRRSAMVRWWIPKRVGGLLMRPDCVRLRVSSPLYGSPVVDGEEEEGLEDGLVGDGGVNGGEEEWDDGGGEGVCGAGRGTIVGLGLSGESGVGCFMSG